MVPMEPTKTEKGSEKNRKLETPMPAPVSRALLKLGADLNRARRRRSLSQQEVATRVGASLSTVKRMESGDPRVPLHFLARTLFLFGELQRLVDLLDSGQDEIGLTLMDDQLPKRIRARKNSPNAF